MPTLNERSVSKPGIVRGIYASNFSVVFSRLLEKTNISCCQIHQFTHLDQGYLSRLKKGEKNNPGPETILKISLAFTHWSKDVKLHDIERLFNSVSRSIYMNSNNI